MTDIIVQKYGGSSLKSPERIKAVAQRIIDTKKRAKSVVAVVSAMGKSTNELIGLASQVSEQPIAREYDALISNGENISASLLSMAINDRGVKAISLTGAQAGIRTESLHKKAKILDVRTQRIQDELDKDQIVIITGFQGINQYDDITTIGRGGSDTSAVVLAAALRCQECEIYTDVDGVYTTDPRLEPAARKLTEVTYDEMLEMASLGAKVLHPRSVECAKENEITIHVRSSFNEHEGTRVRKESVMEVNQPVTGVTLNEQESIISIVGVPDQPGIAGRFFSYLAQQGVNVDMIIQSVENKTEPVNNISFSVLEDDLSLATKLTEEMAQTLKAKSVSTDSSIAKVSIVGVGMMSRPGVAAQMFQTLGESNINIKRITTSEIKVSCAIDRDKASQAVQLLHDAFGLAVVTQ
ncbi:MAG: aspartate kinase [Actinobacteria bacterium]|nr:aspartate kinase [Actinomycetota bacterium]